LPSYGRHKGKTEKGREGEKEAISMSCRAVRIATSSSRGKTVKLNVLGCLVKTRNRVKTSRENHGHRRKSASTKERTECECEREKKLSSAA
jgi:hypothetical protein